jgi:predicted peptidase
MKCWRYAAITLLCSALLLVSSYGRFASADEPAPAPGTQQPQKMERTVKITMNYLLYLPKDYDQQEAWPLMLFLHGAGERGEDLDRVKVHGPPKLIAAGKEFPFVVVSPQCPSDKWWQAHELSALVDEIVERYKIDQDRIYVTGLSMGGYGTWALAAFSPHRFAAAVPICGGGDPRSAQRLPHLPIWVFHGGKDSVVPLSASQEMVDALKKVNDNVKFTVYPEADHDSWTETYNNPELYKWLLEQKRSAQPAPRGEKK